MGEDMYKNAFKNKTVLITGHTGFKGSWLSIWLTALGANVVGISFDVPSTPSNYSASEVNKIVKDLRIDITDLNVLKVTMMQYQPDFVFHLAAQALVRGSYDDPVTTLTINAIGSANVLESLRYLDKQVVAVMITSDKAYDNVEWEWGYRETDKLGGKDPYSASKGMAELAIRSYVSSFFSSPDSNVRVGITRAGNVIGGGDWAKDRIVPDCMGAWSIKEIVDIRNPNATRPWQHVLEPLSGYLALGAQLSHSYQYHGEAYNFGPAASQNHSVKDLIDAMEKSWESVRWNDVSKDEIYLHEAGLLKLNCDKSLHHLQWHPTLYFDETVRMTVEWYKYFYQNENVSMQDFTLRQIDEYTNLARTRGMKWVSM